MSLSKSFESQKLMKMTYKNLIRYIIGNKFDDLFVEKHLIIILLEYYYSSMLSDITIINSLDMFIDKRCSCIELRGSHAEDCGWKIIENVNIIINISKNFMCFAVSCRTFYDYWNRDGFFEYIVVMDIMTHQVVFLKRYDFYGSIIGIFCDDTMDKIGIWSIYRINTYYVNPLDVPEEYKKHHHGTCESPPNCIDNIIFEDDKTLVITNKTGDKDYLKLCYSKDWGYWYPSRC
uniref:Uncharacterized protein n=1 Tax=viral metagenome TaxID=1070528 RepID=A0A6C0BFA3_9ZZZZ